MSKVVRIIISSFLLIFCANNKDEILDINSVQFNEIINEIIEFCEEEMFLCKNIDSNLFTAISKEEFLKNISFENSYVFKNSNDHIVSINEDTIDNDVKDILMKSVFNYNILDYNILDSNELSNMRYFLKKSSNDLISLSVLDSSRLSRYRTIVFRTKTLLPVLEFERFYSLGNENKYYLSTTNNTFGTEICLISFVDEQVNILHNEIIEFAFVENIFYDDKRNLLLEVKSYSTTECACYIKIDQSLIDESKLNYNELATPY